MCDTFIDEIVGCVPQARLDNEKGMTLLSHLISRAKRQLWVREKNLTAWRSDLIISSFKKFLESTDFKELRLAFYKADNKEEALLALKKDREGLWKLLEVHKEKIESGKIKIYWWEKGSLHKQHLVISENDVCTESHYSGPESKCGSAYFFFDSPSDVLYWQQIYERSMSRKAKDDIFSEYSKEELLRSFSCQKSLSEICLYK